MASLITPLRKYFCWHSTLYFVTHWQHSYFTSLLLKQTIFHCFWTFMSVEIIHWNGWFLYCCCVKNYDEFALNHFVLTLDVFALIIFPFKQKLKLPMNELEIIVVHISTQTFCVWSIDCRVIVVRRQERKCQCPRQFGMHWTNARLCKARCYSLIDKKSIEA